MPVFAQTIDIDAARKEARVVVCADTAAADHEGDQRSFRKKYGIRVEYWRASTAGILERALNEWRVGQAGADVIEGNKGPQLILKSEGVFDKFIRPSLGKFPTTIYRIRRHLDAVAV